MPVYCIRAGETGPVKIGFTSVAAYAGRIVKMQVDNHERLAVLWMVEGDKSTEAALHQRFSALRIRGEWFTFSDEMLGDLGLARWVPPVVTYVYDRNKQQEVWTPERRAQASDRMRAIHRDPATLMRLRATLARKRVAAQDAAA